LPINYILDTHIWIWLQEGDSAKLKPDAVAFLGEMQRESRLHVSMISIWEIANLLKKNKVATYAPLETWLDRGLADHALDVLPLTAKILIESTGLPGEIHRDPADRIIIATARVEGMTILTYDARILAYPSVSVERI
jgi:PIN domain nuclease of toxin-antitoxin system